MFLTLKKLSILILILKISFECKNKVIYVISVLILSNISKLVFFWLTTRVITYVDDHLRDIFTKKFHPSASARRAQLSVTATAVRSTDLFNYYVHT